MAVKTIATDSFLAGYLPRALIDWYRDAEPGAIHGCTPGQGTVMCIDVSGFTELTRRLSMNKKEGPEILTRVLNLFFESIVGVISYYEGDILKFTGDAVWVSFPVTLDVVECHRNLESAADQVNQSSDDLSETPLTIHVGAESGTYWLASIGQVNTRMEIEPFGRLIEKVMLACDRAQTGQLVIGPHLAGQLSHMIDMEHLEGDFFLLSELAGNTGSWHAGIASADSHTMAYDSRLEQYLPKDLLLRIKGAGDSHVLQGEYREVTILFATFRSIVDRGEDSVAPDVGRLNQTLSRAFTAISQSGGSIARIDPFYDGHKLLVLYGAPKRYGQDEISAIHSATQLLNLSDKDFEIRMGLAFGSLFCGDVGTEHRKEYTVMGEAVNMAARLMAKASWGGILIDSNLKAKLPKHIFTREQHLSLKGVGRNVVCHEYVSTTDIDPLRQVSDVLIGYESEYQVLNDHIGPDCNLSIISITGEAGIGKTALINRFVNENDNLPSIIIECKHSLLFGHAWAARKLLTQMFKYYPNPGNVTLMDLANERIEPMWLPLLGDILDVDDQDNVWIRGLSQELRMQKAAELYRRLLGILVARPVIVAIDDVDKADDYSRALILSINELPKQIPLMLILTARDGTFIEGSESNYTACITLEQPSKEAWLTFFRSSFYDGKRETELISRLLDISKCNPLFIREYINRLIEQKALLQNSITGRYELDSTQYAIEVPAGINDILMSQFDSLPEMDRILLKIASVFGAGFTLESLGAVSNEHENSQLKERLNQLVDSRILVYHTNTGSFSFANNAFGDIIYSCLPTAYLERIHKNIATYLEEQEDQPELGALALHWYKAKHWSKAFDYSLRAAAAALKLFMLSKVSVLFVQCQMALASAEAGTIPIDKILRFFEEYVSYLVLEGKWANAYEYASKWRHIAKRHGNDKEVLTAALATTHLLWKQSKYGRCRYILQRVLGSSLIADFPDIHARANAVLAEVERRAGNFDKAAQCCRSSIATYRSLSDDRGLSDAYNKLGLALWGKGELEQAAATYEMSLNLGKDTNGMVVQAQTSNNLAIIKWEQGDFVVAAKLMNDALQITKNIGDRRDEAYVSGNLSSIQKILGRFKSSRELLLQSDLIFLKLKDEHAHNYVIGNLGDLDLMEGNLESASRKFTEVSEFARSVGDSELMTECQVRFGEVAFYGGQITAAEKRYCEAIEKAKIINSTEYFMRAAIGLSRLYIGRQDFKSASALIDETLSEAIAVNAVLAQKEIGFIKGELKRISYDCDAAVDYYKDTLHYAQSQEVFELILKCAVRLYEHDQSSSEMSRGILNRLSEQFIQDNGEAGWGDLLESAYFRYFSKTLK